MYSRDYAVPEISEKEATGRVQFIYQDIKHTLKVPVVNFIFRTLAWYETFFSIGWQQVRPNMLTINMEEAASFLRYPEISTNVPVMDWSKQYDQKTIEKIRKTIFTFNYVNTKLLLIASAWAESLANRPINGSAPINGYIEPGVIKELPNIELVSVSESPAEIRYLLQDNSDKHHAMDVASDYRTLANYPDFLRTSWTYLKDYVGTNEYNQIASSLKDRSIQLIHQMPFSVTINRSMLSHYYREREIAGIYGVVAMFQEFLPSLIIDGEFFRRIIA